MPVTVWADSGCQYARQSLSTHTVTCDLQHLSISALSVCVRVCMRSSFGPALRSNHAQSPLIKETVLYSLPVTPGDSMATTAWPTGCYYGVAVCQVGVLGEQKDCPPLKAPPLSLYRELSDKMDNMCTQGPELNILRKHDAQHCSCTSDSRLWSFTTRQWCFIFLSLSVVTLMYKLSLLLWFLCSTSFITLCLCPSLLIYCACPSPFFFLGARRPSLTPTFTLLSSFSVTPFYSLSV